MTESKRRLQRARTCALLGSIGVAASLLHASTARGDSVLLVAGTYASEFDQLTIDFFMPPGPGNIYFETHGHLGDAFPGGTSRPDVPLSSGGIDSIVTLTDAEDNPIALDDDTGGRDSLLYAGVYNSPPLGATGIDPLSSGNYRLRQTVFDGSAFNGYFALNMANAQPFEPGFTVTGFTQTPGVEIAQMYLGQVGGETTDPIKLQFTSPSDTLSISGVFRLYGDHEVTLSAGTIEAFQIEQAGPAVLPTFGTSRVNINGGTLGSLFQTWGGIQGSTAIINHSAGNNFAEQLTLARQHGADVSYNLNGTGNAIGTTLFIGTDATFQPARADFIQSGGTANFSSVIIGPTAPTGGATRLYRLTGGTAILGSIWVRSEGIFELAGGTLQLTEPDVIDVEAGGQFNWLSGTIRLPEFALDSSAGPFLGPTLTLTPGRALEVFGTTTNNSVLTLAGGTLRTHSLTGPGALVFDAGELHLTGAGGLTIGSGGPLGANVSLGAGQTVRTTLSATIQSGALLHLTSGGQFIATTTNNNGAIVLDGAAAQLGGAVLNNSGVLRGEGTVLAHVNNTSSGEIRAENGKALTITGLDGPNVGRINLQGGTLQFNEPITNGGSGSILGRGTLMTGGLTNNGLVQLSGGFSDVFGSVTNNSAAKVIITGGSTSTFYNNVTNNSGGEFRVSGGSSAVFFGFVTNNGTFSGGGTKYFEGGSVGVLGALATPGSTVVESGASITAQHVREQSLTVSGTATIAANGTAAATSKLAALSINDGGTLAMNDNDLIIDYTGASPEFTIRDLVIEGLTTGSGITTLATPAGDTVLAIAEQYEWAGTSFNGFAIDETTIVGKYTYFGDANLDGQVTTDDYVAVDLGLGTGDSWVQGDFDMNGAVTTDDYVVVDLNLGKGTTNPLAYAKEQARMIALHTEMFGQSYVEKLTYAQEHGWVAASVPEPGAPGIVGFAAGGLLGRRRR